MQFSFDLISDLHIETWPEDFDWQGRATSQFCIVAGDVARDRDLVIQTLRRLQSCYQGVFYIDGNDEHKDFMDDLSYSYQNLKDELDTIKNLVYLQDNVVMADGVAIIATNAWWTYDLDSEIDYEQSRAWFQEHSGCNSSVTNTVEAMAYNDSRYLTSSVKRLQTYQDIKKIIIVTHTVPGLEFVRHDISLDGTYRINTTGNPYVRDCLNYDTENKIHTWCFGHYHGDVDQYIDGVRFVNNCRGRGDTPYRQSVYYPKRVTIDF